MGDRGNYRKVKGLLWEWGGADRRISDLMAQIRMVKRHIDELYEVGGVQRIDGQPHATAMRDVFDTVQKLQDIKEEYEEEARICEAEIRQLRELQKTVRGLVETLPPLEGEIIRLRYLSGHTHPYIALVLHISERTVFARLSHALRELDRYIQ